MIRSADDFDVIRARRDAIRAEEICAHAAAVAQREKEGQALVPVPAAPAPAVAPEHVVVGWEEPADPGVELRPPGDDKYAFEGWIERLPIGRLPKTPAAEEIDPYPAPRRSRTEEVVRKALRDQAEARKEGRSVATGVITSDGLRPIGEFIADVAVDRSDNGMWRKVNPALEEIDPLPAPRRNSAGELLYHGWRPSSAQKELLEKAKPAREEGPLRRFTFESSARGYNEPTASEPVVGGFGPPQLYRSTPAIRALLDGRQVSPAMEEVFARLRGYLADCDAGVVVNGEYGAGLLPAPPNLGRDVKIIEGSPERPMFRGIPIRIGGKPR